MSDFTDNMNLQILSPVVLNRCQCDIYRYSKNLVLSWRDIIARGLISKFNEKLGPEKIIAWGNAGNPLGFEVFESAGRNILYASNTAGAAGNASTTTYIPTLSGEVYKIVVNVTVLSGVLPRLSIADGLTYVQQRIKPGRNEFYWTSPRDIDDAAFFFWVTNEATSFSASCSMKKVL